MPPLFIDTCPAGTVKTYTAECLSIAHRLAVELGLAQWSSESRYVGRRDIDRWHTVAMEQGAVCKVQHDLFVDLALTLPEIKSCFRRSYRSLVTSGSRLWRVEVVGAPGDAAVWDEFRQLHATVAGRVTRSLESWQLQHEALANDEGFLVVLRDEDERMVGAGYFMCSSDEGLYAVGAYDRSLFSKPLGHVVQYRAITELKQRGCRWYRIGTHCFPGDQPTPSAKELSIASFKEGFASHAFPGFVLTRATDECVRQAE
jgi:FemAB family protein